jgi:hypothetical protein
MLDLATKLELNNRVHQKLHDQILMTFQGDPDFSSFKLSDISELNEWGPFADGLFHLEIRAGLIEFSLEIRYRYQENILCLRESQRPIEFDKITREIIFKPQANNPLIFSVKNIPQLTLALADLFNVVLVKETLKLVGPQVFDIMNPDLPAWNYSVTGQTGSGLSLASQTLPTLPTR